MSRVLTENSIVLTKQLIQLVTCLNDNSDEFKVLEKNTISKLENADSLYFTNQNELDRIISSLCDKFTFHGFTMEARELHGSYKKLTQPNLTRQDHINRLNVVKFLLALSESPTNNFHKCPYKIGEKFEVDVVDWPKYLQEGIARWSPTLEDDSWNSDSDNPEDSSLQKDESDTVDVIYKHQEEWQENAEVYINNRDALLVYHETKHSLTSLVQSKWFNDEKICFRPASDDREANVAILWDNFIDNITNGLIPVQNSIISEYKVLRDIIWQFYEPHISSCFQFVGNSLVPKSNVTIASVRTVAFRSFLCSFLPYIEWMDVFRDFKQSLSLEFNSLKRVPHTYRSYNEGIKTILDPIFASLRSIENKIKAQEITYTLLMFSNEIRPLFKTVKFLKDIHSNVVIDFYHNSPLMCATTLLYRLYRGLVHVSSKLEQDIYLTLYLHSLFKYCSVVDGWLGGNVLEDDTDEFVIANANGFGEQNWEMKFVVKNLDDNFKTDDVLTIFYKQVLRISKNVHLLRLLGKLHLINLERLYKETLYEVFVEKLLENIGEYFGTKENIQENETKIEQTSPTFIFSGESKYATEMNKLENLVDTNNSFLMKAFEPLFFQKMEIQKIEAPTLFQRIQKLTKGLFSVQQMIIRVLLEVFQERYSMTGTMMKNVLFNDYNLEKQFLFLKNVYLFEDDMIFPIYRCIFEQMDSNGSWGNSTRLTSHLQDVIMDVYPNFYEHVSVKVKDNWMHCVDPIKACEMINIQYRIYWPIDTIIKEEHMEMYRNLFQFILKIKWALFILNHLYFTDLIPRDTKSFKTQEKHIRILIMKLKILRFGFINIFSNIQHYILGHIFYKSSHKFEKALNEAYDLESVVKAHIDFITSLYRICMNFQEYNRTSYGFNLLLYLVRKLKIMWKSFESISKRELDKLEEVYLMCHKTINPIINPTRFSFFSYDV